MKREAGPYGALQEDRLAILAESNVTRLGLCDEQANRGLNRKHGCAGHEVVSSRKERMAHSCMEPSIGLGTLLGALTGKDGTETGGVRAKETAGRGDWESMVHRDARTRLRRSEVADGRLNDVAGVRELARAMGQESAGDWYKPVARKRRGSVQRLQRRLKGRMKR